jgi:hypothetical protein
MAKLKFWTFDHPILDNLPPFSSEKLSTLVKLVQKGNLTAKDELLYQFLSYVKTRLGKILSTDTRLRNNMDGLVSYLIEWLVKLVEQINHGMPDNNILHYVSISLRYRCFDYLGTLLAYGPTDHKYCINLNQHSLCLESIPMPSDAEELLEKLQSVVTTNDEQEFIRLRIEGYKNVEIAQFLGITTTDVSRIRKTLMRHFNEAC